ncbi:hypothetical protein GGI20_002742 [Coemansia sp. BCRC 34301]|nr:hypothetical protein GGI20_002742 [Coemansia sp. BCRC 34301]
MTCIRVNTVSLATFIKLADDTNVLGCSTDSQHLNLQLDTTTTTADDIDTTCFEDVDSILGQLSDTADAWEAETEDDDTVEAPAPLQAIDIPGAKGEKQAATKLERRVSFNLRENTTMQFPSNATISKIAQACSKRRASLIESCSNGGKSYEELAQMADRKAQALLPRGASSELFRADKDGFALTALYVKRGHIRLFDHHGSRSMPVKGVLKPFTPSPINSSFLAAAACSVRSKRHGKASDGVASHCPASDTTNTGGAADDATIPVAATSGVGRKQGKSSKKKKSRSKSRSGAEVDLPSVLPLPISVISQM